MAGLPKLPLNSEVDVITSNPTGALNCQKRAGELRCFRDIVELARRSVDHVENPSDAALNYLSNVSLLLGECSVINKIFPLHHNHKDSYSNLSESLSCDSLQQWCVSARAGKEDRRRRGTGWYAFPDQPLILC